MEIDQHDEEPQSQRDAEWPQQMFDSHMRLYGLVRLLLQQQHVRKAKNIKPRNVYCYFGPSRQDGKLGVQIEVDTYIGTKYFTATEVAQVVNKLPNDARRVLADMLCGRAGVVAGAVSNFLEEETPNTTDEMLITWRSIVQGTLGKQLPSEDL